MRLGGRTASADLKLVFSLFLLYPLIINKALITYGGLLLDYIWDVYKMAIQH